MRPILLLTLSLLTNTFFGQNVQTVTIQNNSTGFCPGDVITVNFTVLGTPSSIYRVKLYEVNSSTSLEPTCSTPVPRPNYDRVLINKTVSSNSTTINLPMDLNPIGYEWVNAETNINVIDIECRTVNMKITTTGFRIEVSSNFGENPKSANLKVINCSASPLPVSYLYFNAKNINNQIQLNWATSSETDNDIFEIEQSIDAKIFKKIGELPADIYSENRVYSYLINDPKYGINYFRIKQFDKNRDYSYSKTIGIDFKNNDIESMKIWPNPTNGVINIQMPNSENGAMISILNSTGKVLKNENIKPIIKNTTLNMSQLQSGIYWLQWESSGKFYTSKIIKN